MVHNNISIIGSKNFVAYTQKTLDLIKRKSKRDYNKIMKYLKVIKQSKKSEMILDKAQFNVSISSAFYSMEWYSGIIVHDVHHYYLHHIENFLWKPKNFLKHEHLCFDEQLRFLIRIRASNHIINHVKGAYKRGHWRQSFKKRHKSW